MARDSWFHKWRARGIRPWKWEADQVGEVSGLGPRAEPAPSASARKGTPGGRGAGGVGLACA